MTGTRTGTRKTSTKVKKTMPKRPTRRRKPSDDDVVVWLDRGWFPTCVGFCPSEAAWAAEMQRLGIDNEPYPGGISAGRCTHLVNDKTGDKALLITIAPLSEERTPLEVVGLLVHEAQHALQFILQDIGEDEPSQELLAYGIQSLTQDLICAFQKTRGFPGGVVLHKPRENDG